MKVAIIGSGPAAMATLLGLGSDQTYQITIFDFQEFSENQADSVASGRGNSNFPSKESISVTRLSNRFMATYTEDGKTSATHLPANLGMGGWSQIWGGTLLPWHESSFFAEFSTIQEMHKHYNEVLAFLPHQASRDLLALDYPILGPISERGRVSSVIEELLQSFANNEAHSKKGDYNIVFGKSRLAVSPLSQDSISGCISCGRCLNGCQFHHIFNSGRFINNLISTSRGQNLTLRKDLYIESIVPHANAKYEIYGLDSKANLLSAGVFDAVFIACGAIGSVSLLQRSRFINEAVIQETPMIIVPGFKLKIGKYDETSLTLSEAFVQIFSENGTRRIIGAGQIYSCNKELLEIVQSFLGLWGSVFRIPKFISNRIIFCMLFVNTVEGSTITLNTELDETKIEFGRKYSYGDFQPALKRLCKSFRGLGILSFSRLAQIQKPGLSYHFGAARKKDSFGEFSSLVDKFGRFGESESLQNLYVTDSSTLQHIEPGPLTLTAMANAHRIASEFILRNS